MFDSIKRMFGNKQELSYASPEHITQDSISATPAAETLKNKGNERFAHRDLVGAADLYRQAIAVEPEYPEAHNNLGVALTALGHHQEALEALNRALSLRPSLVEARHNLGDLYRAMGRSGEAEAAYRDAIAINPRYVNAWFGLANLQFGEKRLDAAIESFRQVIFLDPVNAVARHLLDALVGNVPEKPPQQYVENVFDDYADKFEFVLVEKLHYRIPSEATKLLLEQGSSQKINKWEILDLGCGTGLVGAEMSSHAQRLVGVDLSSEMLKKAQARNIYHNLVCSDLLTMMQSEPDASYDVIFATDVFVYVGKLDAIFAEARRLLREGGFFVYSVEAFAVTSVSAAESFIKTGYKLNSTGRYSHARTYLDRLALAHSLKPLKTNDTQIRFENGVPVPGWLVLCER